MAIDTGRLQERLDALGMNAAQASKLAGLSADTIRNILRGQSKNARSDTISALARVLQCSVSYLLGDEPLLVDTHEPSSFDALPVRWLDVLHEVGAGYWVERASPVAPLGQGPVAPNAKYLKFEQWLERVIGAGADLVFAPGDLIHVVSAPAMGYAPLVGDYVVLVRREGDLEERSIRQVASALPGWAELVAPSSGARFADAITYPSADGRSEIAGKIVGSYRPCD